MNDTPVHRINVEHLLMSIAKDKPENHKLIRSLLNDLAAKATEPSQEPSVSPPQSTPDHPKT